MVADRTSVAANERARFKYMSVGNWIISCWRQCGIVTCIADMYVFKRRGAYGAAIVVVLCRNTSAHHTYMLLQMRHLLFCS